MTRDTPHDLLILGAGPAGSAAAMVAARAGLRVCVIDKARFPRDKLCGGLFTGRAASEYRAIFGRDPDPELFETRRAVVFHLADRPLGRMEDIPPLYLTMRHEMDAHLLAMAQAAGAEIRQATRVARIDLARDRVVLADGSTLPYRMLLGADGVNSAVARALYGRAFDPATIGFALEREMPPETDPETARVVRVDFEAARWGYGWSFPKRHSTTVGVGGLHRLNPDMGAAMHTYEAALGQAGTGRAKGHFLPFGDHRSRPGRGNVMLAGDAAGFVDPITGEGIAHALRSGRVAGQAARLALREGRTHEVAMIYRGATRDLRLSLRIARTLRPVIFAAAMAPVLRRAFDGRGRVARAYLDLLAGQAEYPALLGLVIRRLPGALARAATGAGKTR